MGDETCLSDVIWLLANLKKSCEALSLSCLDHQNKQSGFNPGVLMFYLVTGKQNKKKKKKKNTNKNLLWFTCFKDEQNWWVVCIDSDGQFDTVNLASPRQAAWVDMIHHKSRMWTWLDTSTCWGDTAIWNEAQGSYQLQKALVKY